MVIPNRNMMFYLGIIDVEESYGPYSWAVTFQDHHIKLVEKDEELVTEFDHPTLGHVTITKKTI